MSQFETHLKIPGREELKLDIKTNDLGEILESRLVGIGGPAFLEELANWRERLTGSVKDLELPRGNSTFALMMREILLKAKGEWEYPYSEEELCHCRAIPVKVVDAAIFVGAHTPEQVSRMTSSSTACGTCRPDVISILEYRLDSAS